MRPLLFLLALAFLAGCGAEDTASPAAEKAPGELTFKYTAFGGDDEIDQSLRIDNNGDRAVVPKLAITPLDAKGRPIPGVTVTSAFGSETGSRVIPAHFGDIEFLHFEGARAGDVRDVRVRVEKLEPVDADIADEIHPTRYSGDKKVDDYEAPFDAVELRNPNADAVKAQIVIIAWAAERGGNPQQWQDIALAGPPVTVPAKSRKIVPLPDDLAGISTVSMKAYILKTP